MCHHAEGNVHLLSEEKLMRGQDANNQDVLLPEL